MAFEDILYEVEAGRATITINRPDRLNAFRVQTVRELAEAFETAADDEAVGVIVLTGAGDRAFQPELRQFQAELPQQPARPEGHR